MLKKRKATGAHNTDGFVCNSYNPRGKSMKDDISTPSAINKSIDALGIMGESHLTMSSREIADLCEKEHKNVLADIRRMLDELGEPSAKFSAFYKDQQLIDRPCFNLPKDLTLTLVAGYNTKLRKRIIDRWIELEFSSVKPLIDPMQILNDPTAMRGLLLTYTEKVIALEEQVKDVQPKADALDRISASDGSQCIMDAAKALKVQPKKLFSMLQEKRWIYKRAGGKNWLGYQDKIQSGVIEHDVKTIIKPDGTEKLTERALLTAKGIAKLAGMLNVTVNAQGELDGI